MWVRVDDQVPHHPKFTRAGPIASWLWLCGNCHCNAYLTDGFIAEASVPALGVTQGLRQAVDALVAVGLWHRVEGGYQVHDFHDHNPRASEVKAKREADRLRKESARNPRGQTQESERNPKRSRARDPQSLIPNPDPDPDPNERTATPEPSPVSTLLAYYHDSYLKRYKERPEIANGKDGAILKALVASHGAQIVQARIDLLLDSTDPFIAQSGRTIGVLRACWNKLSNDTQLRRLGGRTGAPPPGKYDGLVQFDEDEDGEVVS